MRLLLIIFVFFGLSGQVFTQAPDSEIFLFSIDKKDGKYVFTGGENISNTKGYDNQPSFSLNSKSILFTSIRNGDDSDIYEYNLKSKATAQITTSNDSEYTAKPLSENLLTFVREGSGQGMTVWRYDRNTKKETRMFKAKEPIAYYAFNTRGDALVWVRYAFMIRWLNSSKSINKYVASYGQPSVPHLVPDTNRFSFLQRHPDDSLWIKEFDPATQAVRPIVQPKDQKKDYCWMPDGSLLIGSGSKLFRFDEKVDKNWVEIVDTHAFGLKDITRMATSADGKYIALVSNQ